MPLEVRVATEADAERAGEIEAAAYGPSPFTAVLFPGPMPADSKQAGVEALAAQLAQDPTARWHTVVDTDLEDGGGGAQVIAIVKWHVYKEPPELKLKKFGPGSNVEACELVFGGLLKQRARLTAERPYIYLQSLQTDPKHKRRGAGSLLVKEVIKEAERLQIKVYLASTETGHSLYRGLGFKDVELLEVDLSNWGAAVPHRTWAMTWEPAEK